MSRGKYILGPNNELQHLFDSSKRVEIESNNHVAGGGVMLLIDCSSSMMGKIRQAKDGAIGFAKKVLPTGAAVGVASFESAAELLVEPATDFQLINGAIEEISIGNSTNMAAGIVLGDRVLGELTPRTIVLVTDGQPDNKEITLEAADNARLRNIDIICIGVDGADQEFLRLIATVDDMAMHVKSANLQEALTASADILLLKGR